MKGGDLKEFLMKEERKDFETNQNISWFTNVF